MHAASCLQGRFSTLGLLRKIHRNFRHPSLYPLCPPACDRFSGLGVTKETRRRAFHRNQILPRISGEKQNGRIPFNRSLANFYISAVCPSPPPPARHYGPRFLLLPLDQPARSPRVHLHVCVHSVPARTHVHDRPSG